MIRATHLEQSPDYATEVKAGHFTLQGDEPATEGGGDTGPRPADLVLSGLATCTVITLRMYGKRKSWQLGDIEAEIRMRREGDDWLIDRRVRCSAELSDEQRTRLSEICARTPMTLLLSQGARITTRLA